jgi:hypothetical protein
VAERKLHGRSGLYRVVLAADGTKQNNVIVLDGGKRFSVRSVLPDKIVTSEGVRLEVKEKD